MKYQKSLMKYMLLVVCFLSSSCSVSSSVQDKPWKYLTPEDVFWDPQVISLAKAAKRGDVKHINQLIDAGVNVNSRGLHGLTPLFLALYSEEKKSVYALLVRGANPNLAAENGRAAIHTACLTNKDPEFLKLILDHGGDTELIVKQGSFSGRPLHEIMLRNNNTLEKMDLLIKAGADINGLSMAGQTPVMKAVFSRQFDVAYKLLQMGGDYKIKDKNGNSLSDVVQSILKSPAAKWHKDQIIWQEKVVSFLQEKGEW